MRSDRSDIDEPFFRVNLRDLLVFQVLAETQSTTIAAERLGVTQSAVSQALGRLETWLGTPLLDRSSRPLKITRGGEILRRGAADILQGVKHTADEVRAGSNIKVPIVRLGLVDSFATTAGPEVVKALRRNIQRLRVWSGLTPSLRAELLDRSLDVIVANDPMPDHVELAREVLFRESFVAAVPREMRAKFRDLSLGQMCTTLPLIRYSGRSHLGRTIEYYLSQRRLAPDYGLEFDVSEAVLRMVSSGVGWAITTPLCLLQARFQAMDIEVLPLPSPQMYRRIYVIYRPNELEQVTSEIVSTWRDCLTKVILPSLESLIPWTCADVSTANVNSEHTRFPGIAQADQLDQ
jgi:DNA-binding transcriptional LysR family regulator